MAFPHGPCQALGMEARRGHLTTWILLFTLGFGSTSRADQEDIPSDAPADAVMASAEEIEALHDWAGLAFTGEWPEGRAPAIRVELRRQDASTLRFGESCLETPLVLGGRAFEHGLGTHAASEIALHLPPGARSFHAEVGVDDNDDTRDGKGSVRFLVETGGERLAVTSVLKSGDAALRLDVALPEGTRELVLKVDPTGDGIAYDQADWADARVVFEDGRVEYADEDRRALLARRLPFSFVYGGTPSAELLPAWSRTSELEHREGRDLRTVRWDQPDGGLRVTAQVTTFARHPAVEWVLEVENAGTEDAPLLEDVRALDTELRTAYHRRPLVLHHLAGDVCGERSFTQLETSLPLGGPPLVLAPVGGRPSNSAFPFFDLNYGESEGLLCGIGWSGQWQASFARTAKGPAHVTAGMERTRLSLRPGERIRTPRVLVLPWKGDHLAAHNRLRRLLLFEYVPQEDDRPLRLPIASQCYDRYVRVRPEWATEAGQLRAVQATLDLGCDTHWLDAAWFAGGFPYGVGSWSCDSRCYPRGLAPVGDAGHRLGLDFLLWFEPERVAAGSEIAREHPEFVHGGAGGGLFRLDDADARRWLTERLSSLIDEYGVDVYRNDFNLDPLPYWRAADGPGREGLTEIRYVDGHHAMWDELRARHPGLWIDDCASGGRRIDLETMMRSVPLWRSDTCCSPGHADWDQVQAVGLGLYVPLSTACAWEPTAYVVRSAAGAGLVTQFDWMDPTFPLEVARAAIAEARENRKFWYGDLWPLTPVEPGARETVAWQLNRPDLDAGIVLAFRRARSPYPAVQVDLRGLVAERRYRVELVDEAFERTIESRLGAELSNDFELRLPERGTSLLARYVAE